MVAPIPEDKKREAIRLRVEDRLGLNAIAQQTGISKSSLSSLLQRYPLSNEEVAKRKTEATIRNNHARKYKPTPSKLAQWIVGKTLSTAQKGHIAEDAVRLRLRVLGYQIHTLPDNSRADLAVSRYDSKNFVRL